MVESTPTRKRKADEYAAEGKLDDLTSNMNRGQTTLESKVTQLEQVIRGQASTIQTLQDSVEVLTRYVPEPPAIRDLFADCL
jgi:uncharacterized protein YaaN involved in tellurite resistance